MNRDIGYLIKQIDDCLHKKANQELESLGLTFSQVRVLLLMREREKARLLTSHKDIEESLGIAHPTVLGLLRRLETKGFIRTETGVADRRIRNVFLAGIDASFWDALLANGAKAEKRLLAGFSKEEATTIQTMLEKILKNIQ